MMPSPESLLTLDVRIDDRAVVIALRGELDPHTAPELRAAMDAAVTDETEVLVFDLGGLVFLDSSGLRVIIAAHRELTGRGGRFVLRAPSDTTRRILDITGLTDLIEVEA
jgi:anti-anti-sigma factor